MITASEFRKRMNGDLVAIANEVEGTLRKHENTIEELHARLSVPADAKTIQDLVDIFMREDDGVIDGIIRIKDVIEAPWRAEIERLKADDHKKHEMYSGAVRGRNDAAQALRKCETERDRLLEERDALKTEVERLKNTNANHTETLRAVANMDPSSDSEAMAQYAKDGLSGYVEPVDKTLRNYQLETQSLRAKLAEAEAVIARNAEAGMQAMGFTAEERADLRQRQRECYERVYWLRIEADHSSGSSHKEAIHAARTLPEREAELEKGIG